MLLIGGRILTHKANNTKYKKKNNMYVYGNAVKKSRSCTIKNILLKLFHTKKHRPTEQERQEEKSKNTQNK